MLDAAFTSMPHENGEREGNRTLIYRFAGDYLTIRTHVHKMDHAAELNRSGPPKEDCAAVTSNTKLVPLSGIEPASQD